MMSLISIVPKEGETLVMDDVLARDHNTIKGGFGSTLAADFGCLHANGDSEPVGAYWTSSFSKGSILSKNGINRMENEEFGMSCLEEWHMQ